MALALSTWIQIEILHTPTPEQILVTLQQIELQVIHCQSFEELDHPYHDLS